VTGGAHGLGGEEDDGDGEELAGAREERVRLHRPLRRPEPCRRPLLRSSTAPTAMRRQLRSLELRPRRGGSRSSAARSRGAVRAVAILFFEEPRERKGERGREKKRACVTSFLAPPSSPPEASTPPTATPAQGEEEGIEDGEETVVLSPRIAGIRNDLAEIGGRVRSGFSMLQNNLVIASSLLLFGQGELDKGSADRGGACVGDSETGEETDGEEEGCCSDVGGPHAQYASVPTLWVCKDLKHRCPVAELNFFEHR
jgi:hypothetical protein